MNVERYLRQTILPEIGETGQDRLNSARVVIIGCGGLGSIVGPYLAGAGVGHLTLIDADAPHTSNLHRQVFYSSEMKGAKSVHLKDHIEALNPDIAVEAYSQNINKSNISQLLREVDLAIECTDDIYTKYLVNDYCHIHHIPMIYGALSQYAGYVSVFENKGHNSIHLRDIFADPSSDIPTCAEVGVLGTAAGLIGMLQANEALKYILQIGKPLIDRLLTYNLLSNEQMTLQLRKTYTDNVSHVFANSIYSGAPCASHLLIDWESVQRDRSDYQVISILEEDEQVALDHSVVHQPLSAIDLDQIPYPSDKKTVYYCQSGKRSGRLVTTIIEKYPEAKVWSLRGGIQGLSPTQ